jgi:hypothetical protein
MKILRHFAQAAIILIVLFALCYVGLYLKVSPMEKEVEQAWAETFSNLDSLPSRFPQTDKNQTAILLEEMFKDGGKLGLRGLECLPPWDRGWKLVDSGGPVAQDAQNYLEAHQSELLSMYEQIRRQAPQWEMDIEKFSACPIPNLLQQRAISRLFLLDAMNKSQQGKSKEAAEAIEAAWIANSSLRRRPELITQLIAMHIDRTIARVAPEIPRLTDEWQERLVEHDYRESIKTALAHQAWVHLQMARVYSDMTGIARGMQGEAGSQLGKLATRLARPYFRLCGANSAEAIRQSLIEYKKQMEHPESFDAQAVRTAEANHLADWNFEKQTCTLNTGPSAQAAIELMKELEEAAKAIRSRKK